MTSLSQKANSINAKTRSDTFSIPLVLKSLWFLSAVWPDTNITKK